MPRHGFLKPVLILPVLTALLVCVFVVYYGQREASTALQIGGPFTLTRVADGKSVTERDFRGKFMLVYFGYTYCPDVCPTTLADLAAALKDLGGAAARVQPIFVTVDPARDTAAMLKSYLAQFSPSFTGLTGSQEQIAAMEKSYRVYAAKTPTGNGPDDYVMDHSSMFYLMDTRGSFVAILRADQDGKALAANLKEYLE